MVLLYGMLRAFGEPFLLITPFALSGILKYVNALETQPYQKVKLISYHYQTEEQCTMNQFQFLFFVAYIEFLHIV